MIRLHIILILLVMCFSACTTKSAQNNNTAVDSTGFNADTMQLLAENPQITAYREFVQSLDSSKAESVTLALSEFRRAFGGKSTGLCDSSYLVLQELIDTVELKLNEKFQEDTTDYSSLFINAKVPPEIAIARKALQKNGFKFRSSEGSVYIEQDRSYVIKNLLPMFSAAMQAYLLQIEKENREGFTEDAGIVISPRAHVERILWYEKFIAENQGFVLLKNCKDYKKAYFTYLLIGIDNTRLYENAALMNLTPYFVKAYDYLLKTYPDSETAALVLPYKQAIEQKQKSVVDELLKKYVIKGLIYSQGI